MANRRESRMRTILANGVFDICHIGHVKHLEAAKKMGDRLIVSITLDEHVNKGPGLPVHTWAQRAEVIRSLRCVDDVIPSISDVEAIRTVKPDIFVKGIDYEDSPLLDAAREACLEVGALLCTTQTQKWSSRHILERLQVCV